MTKKWGLISKIETFFCPDHPISVLLIKKSLKAEARKPQTQFQLPSQTFLPNPAARLCVAHQSLNTQVARDESTSRRHVQPPLLFKSLNALIVLKENEGRKKKKIQRLRTQIDSEALSINSPCTSVWSGYCVMFDQIHRCIALPGTWNIYHTWRAIFVAWMKRRDITLHYWTRRIVFRIHYSGRWFECGIMRAKSLPQREGNLKYIMVQLTRCCSLITKGIYHEVESGFIHFSEVQSWFTGALIDSTVVSLLNPLLICSYIIFLDCFHHSLGMESNVCDRLFSPLIGWPWRKCAKVFFL